MTTYPRIEEKNSTRVLNCITDKLIASGKVLDESLTIKDIEECIPVHYDLFSSVLAVAKEYQKYVYRLNGEYGFDLFCYPSASSAQHVVQSLQLAMLDNENDYINFYIHDLNFGENWEQGQVITEEEEWVLRYDYVLWKLLLTEIKKSVLKNLKK